MSMSVAMMTVQTAQSGFTGVTTAASAVTRPFRSVDLDGDGIPDAPQALTAAKGVGGAITGAAGAVRGAAASLFRPRPTSDRGRVDQGRAEAAVEAAPSGSATLPTSPPLPVGGGMLDGA
nr:hypothetical protein GCM10020063_096350 [Dactylosporangium thailandense]